VTSSWFIIPQHIVIVHYVGDKAVWFHNWLRTS